MTTQSSHAGVCCITQSSHEMTMRAIMTRGCRTDSPMPAAVHEDARTLPSVVTGVSERGGAGWPLAHRRAQDAFGVVLAGVTDADLDRPTPCAGWDVRQLLEHVVAGNWLSAGRADERFDTGCAAAFVTSYAASVEPARQAFDAPGALEREFPVRRRTIPGPTFVALRTIDLLVHAWDLARATGQPTDLDADVVAHCDAFVATVMTPEFRGRHFGPARPAPPGATAADRLAASLGRDVI